MPNSRRRRFSVKPYFVQNESSKSETLSPSNADNQLKTRTKTKSNKNKNKHAEKSLNESTPLQIVDENDNEITCTKHLVTAEKEVNASSSNIDFYNILTLATEEPTESVSPERLSPNRVELDNLGKKGVRNRRDKYPHQHRVKVRSPKRRIKCEHDVDISSIGVDAIDWERDIDQSNLEQQCHIVDTVENLQTQNNEMEDNESNRSVEQMCRICHGTEALSSELGQLISTCGCRGTVGRVHVKCLERWLTESGKSRCELCGTRYLTKRVHKYGFVKALAMWVLNQNAKQLMVDTIGIVLMSPLAVIAAWLSGRTLAGLMTPDSHPTPWPLASTFVLACMTLTYFGQVCYYCWIVSAVSRHALGWWIWYRSQYEVRLQMAGPEE